MTDEHPDEPTSRQRAVRWTTFLAATAFIVYLCLLVLRPFLNVIAWSAVLAITCYPIHQRLVRKTGRTTLSAFLTSALVVLAVVLPLLFMAGIAVNQFVALGQSVQEAFRDQEGPAGRLTAAFVWLTDRFGVDAATVVTWVRQHAGELARGAGQYTLSIAASVTGVIVSFVFIVFVLFLLLRDGKGMLAKVPDFLPFARARSEALFVRIRDVVQGSVYGVVVVALIQGSLCGAMFWVLGIPWAALWGAVTVFTATIPFLGAAAVWVCGAVYLLLTGEWLKAIVLAAWGAGVVSTVDNFLRPRLVAGRVGLGELAMFFAMLGGLQVFGPLGIVLGPVLFATATSMIDVLQEAGPSSAPRASGASPMALPTPIQKEGVREPAKPRHDAP